MSLPLTGRTIAVTRPRAQAGALADAIERAGGTALIYPLLEIVPNDDTGPLDSAIADLESAKLAIFISPNAVRFSVPKVLARRAWPRHLAIAAVGMGTSHALKGFIDRDVICPSVRQDSEGLLELPELAAQRIAGKHVLVFKGEGGRELLVSTLEKRGALVHAVPCYRRLPPSLDPAPLFNRADEGRLDAILVTSTEAVKHLGDLFGCARKDQLQGILIVVTHPQIAEAARRLGCLHVLECPQGGVADGSILAALNAYNWQSSGKPTT